MGIKATQYILYIAQPPEGPIDTAMKRFLFTAFLTLFSAASALAQSANNWIEFNQQYYKIPVAKDGLYHVTYADLVASGFPIGTDPKTVQVFHRGVEQAIYVSGEADGQLNEPDFIEFYGRRNDGVPDTKLYINPAAQPHTHYSLYSDTTFYFLTAASSNGKRIPLYSKPVSGSPENFHWDEKLLVIKDQYSGGIDFGNVQQTTFDIGEGWMGYQTLQNQSITYTLTDILNGFPAGGQPVLELLLIGRGPMAHQAEIYAGARLLGTVSFAGFESYKHTQPLEWSDVGADGKILLTIKVIGIGGNPDRLSAGYIKLRYPQQLNMVNAAEKIFNLRENPLGESLIQLTNVPNGTRIFDITNPSSIIQLDAVQGSPLEMMVDDTQSERKILATNTVLSSTLKPVSFQTITPGVQDFVIISHPFLRRPAGGYSDPVKAYAEYRASDAGGSFDTLIVNTQQLYDQFNYGEQSPLAIFEFMKFLAMDDLPRYLLIIGKGLQVNYAYYRNTAAFTVFKDFVPTAGYPGSDMAFTAGLNGTTYGPAVPTGRISAVKPEDVVAYLNKLKEAEARPFDDLRRKNILHLSGGIEEYEPAQFKLLMEDFQHIAESFYLGGHVTPIAKQSTEIRLINIADELNKGLGMVTFFGHSAPTTQDFDIGYVTDPVLGYNNQGKYPVFLMNGCDAGATFLNTQITSENWINTANKGAVGFIAHSSYGLVSLLKNYSTLFYEVAFGDTVYLRKGIGEVQQELARRYLDQYGVNQWNISQVQQMVLQGDPSFKIFGAPKPDYEIGENNVSISSFDGEAVTALSDSFKLNVVIRNFGHAVNRQFRVEVLRKLNDNTTITYDSIINPVLYSDTLTLVIKNLNNSGFGNNTFTVTVDEDQIEDEISETNNSTTLQYFIPLNSTKNLFPADFAIVNTQQLILAFQNTDLLADEREFTLEVDTTTLFNSAFKKQFSVTGKVLAKQALTLLNLDTTVYYWRTRLADPNKNESDEWDINSFTYINNGPEGWAQVNFPQFYNNPSVGLVKDPLINRLRFEENTLDIAIRNYDASAGKPRDSVSLKINGVEYNLYHENGGATGCRLNTINLVAFDRKSTQPYAGLYFKWYEIRDKYQGRRLICGREPYITNSFKPNELVTGNADDLIQYVDNISEGDSVVLYSIGDAGYASWPAAAKTKLGELGISLTQINDLQTGEPVVIFGKKGAVSGSAQVYRVSSDPQKLVVKRTITGRYNSGEMNSSLIGPALHWHELIVHYNEVEAQDQYTFTITGVRINGTAEVLKTGVTNNEDISSIDANEFPYLRIQFNTTDDIALTPVQLNKWLVTFEPMAEGVILYKGKRESEKVMEGETWSAPYGFVNISNRNFSSPLTVTYKATNVSTFTTSDSTLTIPAPSPGDTTKFSVVVNTNGHVGMNDIEVFVNPYKQPEQYYHNNVINLNNHLNVIGDLFSPVLDVTVDGRHLQNNDLASPHPEIEILLWDENRYLRKKDTVGITVFLAYPCETDECDFSPIHFTRNDIQWQAATDTSDFKINFNPTGLKDGKYTLRVEAEDASGNSSASEPYEITFIVSSETAVIISKPFPNPFDYKTNFTFNVAGSVPPDLFHMDIVSLSGDLVQAFTEADLPDFHIGTNTIRWSGTDGNGNQLPNGVYVYRILVKLGDRQYETRGKVILIR